MGKKPGLNGKMSVSIVGVKAITSLNVPAKMAGMDRAVAISEVQGTQGTDLDQEEGLDMEAVEEPRIQALVKYPRRKGQKLRFRPKSKRMVQVIEGEDGELYLDQEEGDGIEAKINTLTMEDGPPELYQEPDSEDDEITEGLYDPINFLEM